MKNIIYTIILFLLLNNCSSLERNQSESFIFNKEYRNENIAWIKGERFTPSPNDIQKSDIILKQNIKILKSTKINQGNGCPIIYKNLENYNKQYIGYFNSKGEKIIWINFIWNKKTSLHWKNEIDIHLDGCSYYWNLKINLNTLNIFDLFINIRS